MKMLGEYLKARWRLMAFAVAAFLTALAVFALYRLPKEAVVYTSALCLPAALALLWGDARHFFAARRQLQALMQRLAQKETLPQLPLPEAKGALEEDYQALIRALCREYTRLVSRQDRRMQELTDDYTLWVHQIKTPMAAMDLLLQEETSPNSGPLKLELLKMGQYVELLLSYLRLGFDTTDYLLRPCGLDGILRSALRKFAGMFILKKIALDYEETGQTVLTDEKWLRLVIEQLLSNALKYTPSGGTIRIRWEDGALTIADDGIGIPPENLERIFEKGFTGYNGRREQTSSGIGLYLCREITMRLNHRLTITSRVGEGTCAAVGLTRPPQVRE